MSFEDVMLATTYDPEKHNIKGWICSEKYDGIRCYFDSKTKKMMSRNGNEFATPPWFIKDFPEDVDLDGELWIGRNSFEKVGTIRHKVPIDKDWENIKYLVFDAPKSGLKYVDTVKYIKEVTKNCRYITTVDTWICEGPQQLKNDLERFIGFGAEGLMLRKPDSTYERKRSKYLIKVKTHSDSEGVVIGYVNGKGRLEGMTGSLILETTLNGRKVKFNVGTGLDDVMRSSPPPLGSIITFKYWELTENGVPRFPVFVAVRDYE